MDNSYCINDCSFKGNYFKYGVIYIIKPLVSAIDNEIFQYVLRGDSNNFICYLSIKFVEKNFIPYVEYLMALKAIDNIYEKYLFGL